MASKDVAERRLLRVFFLVAAVLALAIFVLAFFPGLELSRPYPDDGGWCKGGRMLPFETARVAEEPLGVLAFLLAALAPGVIAWRSGRLYTGFIWSILTIATSVMGLGALELRDSHSQAVVLWPTHAFDSLILALLGLLLAALPIACGALWLVTRPRPLPFPRARVVRR